MRKRQRKREREKERERERERGERREERERGERESCKWPSPSILGTIKDSDRPTGIMLRLADLEDVIASLSPHCFQTASSSSSSK